ncbi:hypothetical protein IEO21_06569 [Rhodonia placenta]|uniref:JmjC domain-containing protein n=1 Tax=Rhodonia placenta TaxID=104341 RepID=A0A8H7NZQ7_9APHY|nr:hypothetical protein IEO21_06569 [Postia placenta]
MDHVEKGCDYLAEPPSYSQFFQNYLLPNKPVLIGPRLVSSWPAYHAWASHADPDNPQIDWDYLSDVYGEYEVMVADCATREFSDQKRETMRFRDLVALWKAGHGGALYAKDWHLARAVATAAPPPSPSPSPAPSSPSRGPALGSFYTTPALFRDDWMNAYYSACTADDFRFVYAGAAHTFTPLHRDVYASYSWSTNVAGRKRWWLFPSAQTPLLGGEARGDVVPSGWYHQVENLTACISINHNWCNSVNLPALYASMCAKVEEVERALEDVQELLAQNGTDWRGEWTRIVQDVVEKDAGWNWVTFWKMVLHALRIASGCEDQTSSLWEPASPELTPPWSFIKARVRPCFDDFIRREQCEFELVEGLRGVVDAVGAALQIDGAREPYSL